MSELKDIRPDLLNIDDVVIHILDGLSAGSPRVVHDEIDTGPGLLPTASKDLPQFFIELNKAIKDYQNREQRSDSENRIEFSEVHPPKDVKTEIITYRLIHRSPADVSQSSPGPHPNTGRHEWVPRCRYVKEDPSKPNQRVIVMGQYFDNVVEFTCWARTNKVANQRAFWFQDLINIYRFYFKLKGFPEIIFKERLEDIELEDLQTSGNPLKGRPLRYLIRTDRTFSITEPLLRDIILNLGLGSA